MHRSNEAFWWSLFSAGGAISALFVPAFVIVTGVAIPFLAGSEPATAYQRLHHLLGWLPVRATLFIVLFLSFFHCAHRIRHLVATLWHGAEGGLLAGLCYGGALAGSAVALIVLAEL